MMNRRMRTLMASSAKLSLLCRVAALLLTVMMPALVTATKVADPKATLQRVTDCYNEGDWEGCTQLLHDYLRVYETDKNLEDAKNLAYAYLMLSNVHIGYQDYLTAEKYYSKGLSIATKWGLHEDELKFRTNLAATCAFLGNMTRAREYSASILKIPGMEPSKARFNYLTTSALIQRKSGNWQQAVDMYQQSIAVVDSNRMWPKMKVTPYSEITEIYEEQGITDSALYYLDQYEKIAREYNMQSMVVDAQRLAMRIYTRLGDPGRALYYQDRYISMQDSLLNKSRFFDKASRFEKEKRDKEALMVQNMKILISRQHLILLIVGVVLIVSLVFTGIILRQKKRLHSSYKQLYEINRRLLETPVSAVSPALPASDADPDLPDDEEQIPDDDNPEFQAPERKALIKAIEEVMERTTEWCSPDFSLGRLAELTSSNTRYISQAINETYGKNFRTYINEYRIREAMRRLADSDNYGRISIQGIGESVGFLSRTTFISAFKKQVGMTPSIYQKMAREGS